MHKDLQLLCVEPTLREGGRKGGREERGREGRREGGEGGRKEGRGRR